MKKVLKAICIITSASLALAGCGTKKNSSSLRYWTTFNNSLVSNRGDLEFSKFLEEATGVSVTYEHPAIGSEKEGFNIMMASDDLPDVIQYNWEAGMADTYINDGFILDLTPYYEKGLMPNLQKIFEEHPEYKKMATSASGKLFYFPQILEDKMLSSYYSYYINKDFLDEAGLDVPETLDEWETCLYKFKEMGVKTPITLNLSYPYLFMSPFMGPFNEIGSFYHDEDNKIHYGPGEEAFGDWMKLMAKWYRDGILDSEFVDQSSSRIAAMVTNGEVGAYYGLIGGQYGAYLDAMSPPGKHNYVPVKVPVKNKGDIAMYNQSDPMVKADGAAIGGTCADPEAVIKFLDYGYSEEGQLLWNFGKEGVSYNMVEGKPVYSDLLTNPAKRDGKTFAEMLSLYTQVSLPVSVQRKDYIEQYYEKEQQVQALRCASDTDAEKYRLPNGMFTEDQQKIISDKFTPIKTYADETISKIIAGKVPESEITAYFDTIKKMGIQEVIDVYQDAYNNYLKK